MLASNLFRHLTLHDLLQAVFPGIVVLQEALQPLHPIQLQLYGLPLGDHLLHLNHPNAACWATLTLTRQQMCHL